MARSIAGYSKPKDSKISAATMAYYSAAVGLKEGAYAYTLCMYICIYVCMYVCMYVWTYLSYV